MKFEFINSNRQGKKMFGLLTMTGTKYLINIYVISFLTASIQTD